MMTRIYAYIFAVFFFFPSSVFAVEPVRGIPDFVNDGTLILTITCDSGATKFSRYDIVFNEDDEIFVGRWVVFTFNGEITHYIFYPNLNSISPVSLLFAVNTGGGIKEISRQKLEEDFKTKPSEINALLNGKKNNCTREIFNEPVKTNIEDIQ